MAKRLLCVLLSVLMVVAMLPAGVFADDDVYSYTSAVGSELTGAAYANELTLVSNSEISDFKTHVLEEDAYIELVVSGTSYVQIVFMTDSYSYDSDTSYQTTKDNGDGTYTITISDVSGFISSLSNNDATLSNLNSVKLQKTWQSDSDSTVTIVSFSVVVPESVSKTVYSYTSAVGSELTGAAYANELTLVSNSEISDFKTHVLEEDAYIELVVSGTSYVQIVFMTDSYSYDSNTEYQSTRSNSDGTYTITISDVSGFISSLSNNDATLSNLNSVKLQKTWQSDSDSTVSIVSFSVLVPESSSTTPTLYGKTLTLDGSIGVTYYFDMGELDASDYTLKGTLSYDGNETAVAVSASSRTVTLDGTEYTRYTVPVTIATFLGTIDVDLVDSNGDVVVALDDYSASDYCTAKANDATVGDLCKALVTYAYYADVAINENSGTSITGYEDMSSYTGASSLTASTDTSGIEKTIVLGDTVYIRIYVDGTANTYTVSGRTVTSTSSYIEFPVAAKELASDITIYKDGEEYMTYSVYTYVANQLSSSSSASDAVKNLCKAVYYYGQAASSFTSWQ